MARQKPKVTLAYSKTSGDYYVEQIRGSSPTVDFRGGTVRIGDWLSEADCQTLGLTADLTIKAYTGFGG